MTESPVVLVTGASGRLGAAMTRALAARGATLVLVDRAAGPLETLRASVADVSVLTLATDVTAVDAASSAVQATLDRFGRLDALINGAGVEGPIGRVEDLDEDSLRLLFEVNVFALIRFSGAVMGHFRARGAGRIVNVASGAGLRGTGMMAAYSASKHAVVGLTRSMAKEAADRGIVVNAVCPGCVDSPMMERIEARMGELAGSAPVSFLSDIPAGRYAAPEEVADLTCYLALDAPTYITGSALTIDGGLGA